MALKLGLLGRKLGYSRSPFIHGFLAAALGVDLEYRLIETEVPLSVFGMGLDGFNVTVPWKEAVIPGLDAVDPLATRAGAVNAVVRREGKWIGFNTDCAGFRALLERASIEVEGASVLILGTGGAAKAAAIALMDSGASRIGFASRRAVASADQGEGNCLPLPRADGDTERFPVIAYDAVPAWSPEIIVNATPLGTSPDESNPLHGDFPPSVRAAVDLVYNPFLTPFLRKAVAAGIASADGLDMLAIQGARAFELWTGELVDAALESRLVRHLRLRACAGIALVGMPFSGKSRLLREAALPPSVPRFDLDDDIVREAGMDITAIFAAEGEAGFRARETAALRRAVSAGTGLIACGGGVLTRPENLELLKNHLIVWLDTPLEELRSRWAASRDSRPLLKSAADLDAAWERREPIYRSAARFRGDRAAVSDLLTEWAALRAGASGGGAP